MTAAGRPPPRRGRGLGYLWALPNTLLGLPLVLLGWASGGSVERRGGTLEAWGPLVALLLRRCVPLPGGAAAVTLGHVVLGRDAATLSHCRAHERVHVGQYELWGPFFLPLYLAAGVAAWLAGKGAYHGNRFERDARDRERA